MISSTTENYSHHNFSGFNNFGKTYSGLISHVNIIIVLQCKIQKSDSWLKVYKRDLFTLPREMLPGMIKARNISWLLVMWLYLEMFDFRKIKTGSACLQRPSCIPRPNKILVPSLSWSRHLRLMNYPFLLHRRFCKLLYVNTKIYQKLSICRPPIVEKLKQEYWIYLSFSQSLT